MAAKFVLVAHDTYQRLINRKEHCHEATSNAEKPEVHIYGLDESSEDPILSTLIELLPRTLKGKGKVLMHYLYGKITLDEQSRVIYTLGMSDDSTTEETGSHILDLVKYAISPAYQFGSHEEPSSARPIDWPRFQQLLVVIGVPQSSLGAGKRLESSQILPPKRKHYQVSGRIARRNKPHKRH